MELISQPVSGPPVLDIYFHQDLSRIKLFHYIHLLFVFIEVRLKVSARDA